jgi:hypothetical protein
MPHSCSHMQRASSVLYDRRSGGDRMTHVGPASRTARQHYLSSSVCGWPALCRQRRRAPALAGEAEAGAGRGGPRLHELPHRTGPHDVHHRRAAPRRGPLRGGSSTALKSRSCNTSRTSWAWVVTCWVWRRKIGVSGVRLQQVEPGQAHVHVPAGDVVLVVVVPEGGGAQVVVGILVVPELAWREPSRGMEVGPIRVLKGDAVLQDVRGDDCGDTSVACSRSVRQAAR